MDYEAANGDRYEGTYSWVVIATTRPHASLRNLTSLHLTSPRIVTSSHRIASHRIFLTNSFHLKTRRPGTSATTEVPPLVLSVTTTTAAVAVLHHQVAIPTGISILPYSCATQTPSCSPVPAA